MAWQAWHPGPIDRFRKALTSSTFQLALQLAVGLLLSSLVVVVPAISYTQSCTVSTLYLVMVVMMSPNNHFGTRITAAASIIGPIWLAAALAGIVATLAKLSGSRAAATAIEAALSCLILLFLVINRVGTQPPTLWALGMVTCLGYGLALGAAHSVWPIAAVWRGPIVSILLSALASAVAAILTSWLVLPSLASDAVQKSLCKVIRSAGHSTTSYASLLFPQTHKLPPEMQQAAAHARSAGLVQHVKLAGPGDRYMFDWQDAEGYLAWLELATRPTQMKRTKAHVAATPGLHPTKSLAQLDEQPDTPTSSSKSRDMDVELGLVDPDTTILQRLGKGPQEPAVVEGRSVTAEPSAADLGGSLRHSKSVIQLPPPGIHCRILRDPSAAVLGLRPLLANAGMMLNQARVEPALLRAGRPSFAANNWGGVLAACQLLVTRLAAFETLLEDGELINEDGESRHLPATFRLVFAQLAASLNRLADAVDPNNSSKQGAAGAFCSAVSLFGRTWEACREELMQEIGSAVRHHWQRVMQAQAVAGSAGNIQEVRVMFYTWTLCNGLIIAVERLEAAVATAVCGPGAMAGPIAWEQGDYWGWVKVHTAWLGPLVPLVTNQYLWLNWRRVFTQTVPAAVRSRAGLVALLRDRYFQAGLKYWATLSVALAAVLAYLHLVPGASRHSPVNGFVGAALCLSERVEATASKVSFWLLGSTAGAVLGLAAMWHPSVASNPYLLVLILVVAAAAVGLLGRTQFRITSTLTLMTLSALVLCQYVGCCGATGSVELFAVRVVSVCTGVLFAAAVSNLVLPWYTSAWALDTMASFLTNSMRVLQQMYDRFYADGQAAAAATRAEGACPNHVRMLLSNRASGSGAEDVSQRGGEAGQLASRIDSHSALGGPVTPAAAAGPADTASPAAGAPGAVPVTSPGLLQSPALAGALVAVQVSLVKDAAAWKRGVLATPPVVWAAHRQLLELLDALAALQMTLQQGPAVTGAFRGNAFTFYLHPLRGLWQAAMDQAAVLAAATATHLRSPSCAHAAEVKKEVQKLSQVRREMAQQQVLLRDQLHERVWQATHMAQAPSTPSAAPPHTADMRAVVAVAAGADGSTATPAVQGPAAAVNSEEILSAVGAVDDIIRYMSFQAAWIKVMNKVMAAARATLRDECQARQKALAWVK